MPRDRFEIPTLILEAFADGPTLKTHIVYKTNLNFKQTRAYLNILLSSGCVMEQNGTYCMTEKGRELLERLRRTSL